MLLRRGFTGNVGAAKRIVASASSSFSGSRGLVRCTEFTQLGRHQGRACTKAKRAIKRVSLPSNPENNNMRRRFHIGFGVAREKHEKRCSEIQLVCFYAKLRTRNNQAIQTEGRYVTKQLTNLSPMTTVILWTAT